MKKISNRSIGKIVFATVLLVVIYLSLNKFHDTVCEGIDICIQDSAQLNFVNKNDVLDMIHQGGKNIAGYKMDNVDVYELTQKVKQNPYVRNVSIYKTVSGRLKVDVRQRKPILLVMGNKQDYYIDEDGCVFPASDKYPARTLVVTGCIQDMFDFTERPYYQIYNKGEEMEPSMTLDLFKLGRLIMADDFWRDQVAQIYVTTLNEYELVPMAGRHILALGSIDEYDRKMYILKQFYLKGLNKTGWNRYSLISVKYNGQIVCKRNKDKIS